VVALVTSITDPFFLASARISATSTSTSPQPAERAATSSAARSAPRPVARSAAVPERHSSSVHRPVTAGSNRFGANAAAANVPAGTPYSRSGMGDQRRRTPSRSHSTASKPTTRSCPAPVRFVR
jgi:hypothetical protein